MSHDPAEIERLMADLHKAAFYGSPSVLLVKAAAALLALEKDEQTHAARDVLAERARQIEKEGWTPQHDDDEHANGELAMAAACYAKSSCRYVGKSISPAEWPWDRKWWKPTNSRHDLVRAGALILAEIERLDRAAVAASEKEKR